MDDEPKLPGGAEGLDDESVEALLSSLGNAAKPPDTASKGEKKAAKDESIIKQKDIDALLNKGLKAGKDALGTSKELIAASAEQVFSGEAGKEAAKKAGIDLLLDVPLRVKIELGRNKLTLEDILRLKEGSVVELNKLAGDPLDVLVNDRLVAKGEVLVLNDNFCIRVTEIVNPDIRKPIK